MSTGETNPRNHDWINWKFFKSILGLELPFIHPIRGFLDQLLFTSDPDAIIVIEGYGLYYILRLGFYKGDDLRGVTSELLNPYSQ